jgi:hypothetical protein
MDALALILGLVAVRAGLDVLAVLVLVAVLRGDVGWRLAQPAVDAQSVRTAMQSLVALMVVTPAGGTRSIKP